MTAEGVETIQEKDNDMKIKFITLHQLVLTYISDSQKHLKFSLFLTLLLAVKRLSFDWYD